MNPGPFFNPFINFQNNEYRDSNYDKILNKIERLEKNIKIIENRLNKIENSNNKVTILEEPTDMYMI